MRFITEFELEYPYTLFDRENFKFELQAGFGNKIAESFQWKEIGYTTINGPVKYRASIEIEVFPMDKWIEFRNILKDHVATGNPNITKVWLSLLELESFGKPEHEQSKTTK